MPAEDPSLDWALQPLLRFLELHAADMVYTSIKIIILLRLLEILSLLKFNRPRFHIHPLFHL